MDRLSNFGNKNCLKIYLKLHILLRAVFAKLSDHLTCLVKKQSHKHESDFFTRFSSGKFWFLK